MKEDQPQNTRGNFINSSRESGTATTYVLVILAIFMLGLIIILNVVTETRSQVTKEDFTNLESYRSDLETALKETRVLNESDKENSIAKTNESLRALIDSLQTANSNEAINKETLLKSLNEISSQLQQLNTELGSEQKIAGTRLGKMNEQINFLKDKAKPKNDITGVLANILTYLGSTLVALAYPLVILVIVLIFVFSKRGAFRLSDFLGQFKSVKFFSTEFVLNEATKMKAEETLSIYRNQVMSEHDLFVQKNSISQIFNKVSEQFVGEINTHLAQFNKKLEDFRCTLHVPDLLFAETFYQLLDYYTDKKSGKTRGRTWSFRFGIIGKTWRSRHWEITEQVPVNDAQLIQEWGMTDEEAKRAGKGRQSFFCALIKNENDVVVGMFYLDAKDKFAFTGVSNDREDIEKELRQNFSGELKQKVEAKQTAQAASSTPGTKTKDDIERELKESFDANLNRNIETELVKREKTRNEIKERLEKQIKKLCQDRKLDALLAKMKEELGGRAPLIRVYNEY